MKNYRVTIMGALAAFALAGTGAFAADAAAPNAAEPALPNLAGTYQCESLGGYCNLGKTFTVTQNGAILSVQNDQGVSGTAALTSNVMVAVYGPWNLIGVIVGAKKDTIQFQDGTRWVRTAG